MDELDSQIWSENESEGFNFFLLKTWFLLYKLEKSTKRESLEEREQRESDERSIYIGNV